ncbi:MAG: hypothetical protein ABIT08_08920 [Bacteroidia bacterium]
MEENPDTTRQENKALPPNDPKTDADKRAIEKWQSKIMWWLIAMPTILIGIFIYMASKQITSFNQAVSIKADTTLLSKILPEMDKNQKGSDLKNDSKYLQLVMLAHLEEESIYRRYNQGGLLLMSRIFVKYFGFLTGMIITVIGSVFIIGKLSENYSQMTGTINEKTKFSLVSSSPGIIFGVLGTILMLSTILQHQDIVIQDSPLYLNSNGILSVNSADYFSKKTSTTNTILDASEADSIFDVKPPKK